MLHIVSVLNDQQIQSLPKACMPGSNGSRFKMTENILENVCNFIFWFRNSKGLSKKAPTWESKFYNSMKHVSCFKHLGHRQPSPQDLMWLHELKIFKFNSSSLPLLYDSPRWWMPPYLSRARRVRKRLAQNKRQPDMFQAFECIAGVQQNPHAPFFQPQRISICVGVEFWR